MKSESDLIDILWPNCSVPDCPNKSCLRLDSDKCYPHTTGTKFRVWNDPTEKERE